MKVELGRVGFGLELGLGRVRIGANWGWNLSWTEFGIRLGLGLEFRLLSGKFSD